MAKLFFYSDIEYQGHEVKHKQKVTGGMNRVENVIEQQKFYIRVTYILLLFTYWYMPT